MKAPLATVINSIVASAVPRIGRATARGMMTAAAVAAPMRTGTSPMRTHRADREPCVAIREIM